MTREVPVSIPLSVLGDFQVTFSSRPNELFWGSTQPPTEMNTKEFAWGQIAAGAYN